MCKTFLVIAVVFVVLGAGCVAGYYQMKGLWHEGVSREVPLSELSEVGHRALWYAAGAWLSFVLAVLFSILWSASSNRPAEPAASVGDVPPGETADVRQYLRGVTCGSVPGWIRSIKSWDEILAASKANYVVVGCVDSDHAPSHSHGLRKIFKSSRVRFACVGDYVVLTTESFLQVLSVRGFFCGFDEVWFYESSPTREQLCTRSITSDGLDLNERVPADLAGEFVNSSSAFGLGDGCCLNYITRVSAVADLITRDLPEDSGC